MPAKGKEEKPLGRIIEEHFKRGDGEALELESVRVRRSGESMHVEPVTRRPVPQPTEEPANA